jgi:phospho-N-acetylmuramoyl-pentapeptide-transferase
MNIYYIFGIGVFAFAIGMLLTAFLIPVLKKAKAGQNIREEGPASHHIKAGTPSMGGLAIIGAIIVAGIAGGAWAPDTFAALLGFLLFAAIGFIDDYLKVVKKQNEGLLAWQKFSMQFVISLGFAIYMVLLSSSGTEVFIPFWNQTIDFGGWYIPFIVFTILAMVNAINLTDGLDGLATGVTAIVTMFFVFLAYRTGNELEAMIYVSITGACLGFLVYNRYPAKIFMGDTGSLALGGAVALTAIVMKMELFLPIVGFIYVVEALSVVLQVGYFKATKGKRIFKMAPIHHHFEKSGMQETKVVLLFWLVTMICCLGALITL